MTTTAELLQALRGWLAEQAPGLVPSALSVSFLNHAAPLSLPLATVAPLRQGESDPKEDERATEHFSQCIVDILTALETARKPLTETRLLAELARAGKEWGRRTVEGYLKQMVDDGTITNPKGAKPPGYRLPEWGDA